MKHLVPVIGLSLVLTGCDGDMIKRVARAILADEEPQQAQVIEQPQELQHVIVQSPNNTTPTQQQQPTTIVVQSDSTQRQAATSQPAAGRQSGATHYIQTETDGYVYMRSGPDAKSKKIKKLVDGTRVRQIHCDTDYTVRTDSAAYYQDGYWCKVNANGATGYVFSAYMYEL